LSGLADLEFLKAELERLGPWHIEVEVVPGLTTAVARDERRDGGLAFKPPKKRFTRLLSRIYPNGLEGRSVLDCACNCGAFSFFAKELGAGPCLGFDAREHWIEQARFLAANRAAPTDGMRFEVCELDELPKLASEPADLTIFNGIFYHLPDPVAGLKIAADLTRELLILNTSTALGYPDGVLVAASEGPDHPLSGVHGLNWFPSGPRVVIAILAWMGFPAARCTNWRAGRTEVIAARDAGTLAAFDSTRRGRNGVREIAATSTPPGATVVVAGDDPRLLWIPGRKALKLTPEALREADYLLVPGPADVPRTARPLTPHVSVDGVCSIFALGDERQNS
jgi:SAM-dependent methyltransferase